MLEKFLPRTEFDSYEDFKKNYTVNAPEDFNFGFDIVDGWAKEKPDLKCLLWIDDDGNEKSFTFSEMSKMMTMPIMSSNAMKKVVMNFFDM